MAQKEASILIKIKEAGSEVLDKLAGTFADLGKIGVAAFGAIQGVIVASIFAYREQEEATNSLNQALIQQGIYTSELSQHYLDLAGALQKKTMFADEDITQSIATLQSYLGQTQVTDELVKSTLDLAQAKGIDLNSAAQMVGKSIGTETNALARSGIAIDENATKTEKLSLVVQALNGKFGGQAEAAAKGLGSFKLLQHATGELLETIGAKFAPAVVLATEKLIKLAETAQTKTSIFDGFLTLFKMLAKAAVLIGGEFATLGNGLAGLAAAASQITLDPRKWAQSLDAMKAINAAANAERVRLEKETQQLIKEINDLDLSGKQQKLTAEQEALKKSEERKRQIIEEEATLRAELINVKSQEELVNQQMMLDLKENQVLQNQLRTLEKEAQNAATAEERHRASYQKRQLVTQAYYDAELRMAIKNGDLMAIMNSKRVRDFDDTMSNLARLQDSKNKEMVAVGKAAAIAHIGIQTAQGAISAYASLAPIPIVGPALGAVAAALLVAYGAEQIGRVNAQHMAEGGIVKAQPGGVNAVIGEGGQDEAVIPLDEAGMGGALGATYIFNVNGGLLGDAQSAREFAVAVDRELLKLRQSNQSLAFETGIV